MSVLRRKKRAQNIAAKKYFAKNIKSEQRYTRTALWAETLTIDQLETIAKTGLMIKYPAKLEWEKFGEYIGGKTFGNRKKKPIPTECLHDVEAASNTDMEAILVVLGKKLKSRKPQWLFLLFDKFFNKQRYNFIKNN